MDSEFNQKKGRKRAFVPPTLDDVQAYMDKIGECRFTAVRFCNYYEAKGWMLGRTKMKNWKVALNIWVERENTKGMPKGNPQTENPARNTVTFNAYKPVDNTGAVSYEEYIKMKSLTPNPSPKGEGNQK